MEVFVGIGFLAFAVAALVVGIRLLLLWRRTRMLPELLIGIGVLGIGPVGFGGLMVGTLLASQEKPLAGGVCLLGSLAVIVGVQSNWIFNWRVYHPQSRRIAVMVSWVAALQVANFLYRAFDTGFIPHGAGDLATHFQSVLQLGCLLWGSFEALRFWMQMRRRVALGLATPELANRFLLWGIGTGSAGLGSALGTSYAIVTGIPYSEAPWMVATLSAHGFVAAVAMWLAFLPPAAYTRWIHSRLTLEALD